MPVKGVPETILSGDMGVSFENAADVGIVKGFCAVISFHLSGVIVMMRSEPIVRLFPARLPDALS